MITEPTVFILGAGASVPYGYPTGTQLREQILEISTNKDYQALFQICGHDVEELNEFTEAFRKSGTNSIDAFLEYRNEYLDIGKIAISILLIRCEDDQKLHSGDWYRYIFEKLNTSFDDFSKNKLKVLTFNYDRSFEHFLFEALKNKYGKTNEECKSAVESIPIIHLYGKVGNLEWQGGNRPYAPMSVKSLSQSPYAREWLNEAKNGIKITHEKDLKPSEEFDKALEYLLAAKRIYFLGFGYHPINVERLRISNLDKGKLKQATGTSYNLTDNERGYIQATLLKYIFNLSLTNVRHLQILDFLREFVTFQ